MKKRLFFHLIFTFSCCFLLFFCAAQPANYKVLDANSKSSIVKKIETASSQMNSLQVAFTQEKSSGMFLEKVVSKGKMYYKKSSMLKWAYSQPTNYAIIINPRGAFFKTGNKVTKNKMISELGNLLLHTINGQLLTNNNDFSITYYKKDDILAILKPQNKRLKELYSSIEVYLHPQTYIANKVILKEKNGDITEIKFSNPQKNITIADAEFQE